MQYISRFTLEEKYQPEYINRMVCRELRKRDLQERLENEYFVRTE